ncbi:acyl-ACP--UDP-N-acetylglucosamine O-acyltransferase [Halarsenatibacter silvermanii]|uniref:Acyl-[acyl-carrier-protein]--UDP-N-acetylglucosamine O-acyltransferase n=1 Tax=Halarsenatibacter silvermanii TaxID=321763 RepID=A0A1G9LWS3_9FIRM|nr:hypothetical protein [Halarsenatibacter silvermanii]SDL66428.1 acyl-[acyl-carrier-protein]--UDP-N-acetylglucosamine O-acyltransferase [Halarsenatibacter silvermanii]
MAQKGHSEDSGHRSLIDPEAEVAEDVELGEGVIIGPEVVIKEGTFISSGVEIRGDTYIGCNNYIDRGVLMGFQPQHLGYDDERTRLIIGNNNYIGTRATLHRGTEERGMTKIGDGNHLGTCVHIAHDCLLADNIRMEEFTQLGGHVEIGSHSQIGALTGIHQFVRLGSGSQVEPQAKVNQDVPPYLKAGGHPARLKGPGNCPDSEVKLQIARAFELLCRSDLNVSQAAKEIEANLDGAEITEFLTFLDSSDRGICR